MKRIHKNIYYLLILVLAFASGCIEELDLTEAIADEGTGLLVVEASFNDQLKRQKVYLSRSSTRFDIETDTVYSYVYPLGIGDRDSVNVEQNARIKVMGTNGESYDFVEDEPGTYLSSKPFAIQLYEEYKLQITTRDGAEYTSDPASVIAAAEIEDVIVERTTNDIGMEGLKIMVDSRTITGIPKNYRFTYDETFKIIAPKWNSQEFLLNIIDPCFGLYTLEIIDRPIQNRICYKTVSSNTIIQTNITDAQSEISRFPVRFISRDNFIITHRYSILVQQHVQNLDSYLFYDTLKKISESESVFSQIQPGLLQANIERSDGADEIVLGYFEINSSSEKRIYFDYDDFFPGEELPPFPYDCNETSSTEAVFSNCESTNPMSCPPTIINRVNKGIISFTGLNDIGIGSCPGPYTYVPRVCGDCLILGENVAPDFWVE